MDRFDEWSTFVAVATRLSFVEAARAQRRSPQAITRAVAALEVRLRTRLFHRTTRAVSLTDDGARYLDHARQLLADLDALEQSPSAELTLRGSLTVAASVLFGQMHVLPAMQSFLDEHPQIDARVLLHDRVVSLSEEGVDLAFRIGALPDSSLRAQLLGHVRSVICASPAYLKRHGRPRSVEELAQHGSIAFTGITPIPERWSFPMSDRRDRVVRMRPRLTVNSAQGAIDAAVAGFGVVRLLSYQVAEQVARKQLQIVLREHEPAPLAVHLVQLPGTAGRLASSFADFAFERLRGVLSARG